MAVVKDKIGAEYVKYVLNEPPPELLIHVVPLEVKTLPVVPGAQMIVFIGKFIVFIIPAVK